MVLLGLHVALKKPPKRPSDSNEKGLIVDCVSAFLLTLTNPLTILAFAAGFATLGVGGIQVQTFFQDSLQWGFLVVRLFGGSF